MAGYIKCVTKVKLKLSKGLMKVTMKVVFMRKKIKYIGLFHCANSKKLTDEEKKVN